LSEDQIATVLMPLLLALIMFSLGLGLVPADFRRIAAQPRAFLIGFACHFVLLPLVCFALLSVFPLPGVIAVGFMLIAACPTGTTSNLLTYIARGDVALALSFTAAASLMTIITLPLIVTLAMGHFLGAHQQIDFPVGFMMIQVFAMLGLPVALGMLTRRVWPSAAQRFEPLATRLSTLAFAIIVVGALVKNWSLFEQNFSVVAPLALALNALMLILGFVVAKLGHLERRQAVTIAIETAMQNATLAIVIGSTVLRDDALVVPAAIYGVLMYVGGLVFAFTVRRSYAPVSAEKADGSIAPR
jgi:BASS family bile acid:Na+ symporter